MGKLGKCRSIKVFYVCLCLNLVTGIRQVKLEEGFQLQYKLQGKGVDEDPKGLFHIDEDTGSIYVHQKIDYEKTPLFQVSHLFL